MSRQVFRFPHTTSPTIMIIGYDEALGEFFDIRDDRFAGRIEDPQGEGFLFEWSQRFGITNNRIGLEESMVVGVNKEINRAYVMGLVETFIDSLLLDDMHEWFNRHKISMTGVSAGDYIDDEDFYKYATGMQKANKALKAEIARLKDNRPRKTA